MNPLNLHMAARLGGLSPHGKEKKMSDNAATTDTAASTTEATSTATDSTATEKVTDWKAEARKWEDRAKENKRTADANADAATKWAEAEEANKTELQREKERADAAEQRANEVASKALRIEVAAAKGVPAALLTGSTKEELEAAADTLIAFRGAASSGPIVHADGSQPDANALNGDGIESALRKALGIN